MSNSKSPGPAAFPYDHLAVIGFRKLQRYVPPSKASARTSARTDERDEGETPPAPPSVPAPLDTAAKPARH